MRTSCTHCILELGCHDDSPLTIGGSQALRSTCELLLCSRPLLLFKWSPHRPSQCLHFSQPGRHFSSSHTFQEHLLRDQDKPLLGTVFSPLGDGETICGKGSGKFPFYGALEHAKHPTYIHYLTLPGRDCFHSCFCTWENCSLGEGQVSALLARG